MSTDKVTGTVGNRIRYFEREADENARATKENSKQQSNFVGRSVQTSTIPPVSAHRTMQPSSEVPVESAMHSRTITPSTKTPPQPPPRLESLPKNRRTKNEQPSVGGDATSPEHAEPASVQKDSLRAADVLDRTDASASSPADIDTTDAAHSPPENPRKIPESPEEQIPKSPEEQIAESPEEQMPERAVFSPSAAQQEGVSLSDLSNSAEELSRAWIVRRNHLRWLDPKPRFGERNKQPTLSWLAHLDKKEMKSWLLERPEAMDLSRALGSFLETMSPRATPQKQHFRPSLVGALDKLHKTAKTWLDAYRKEHPSQLRKREGRKIGGPPTKRSPALPTKKSPVSPTKKSPVSSRLPSTSATLETGDVRAASDTPRGKGARASSPELQLQSLAQGVEEWVGVYADPFSSSTPIDVPAVLKSAEKVLGLWKEFQQTLAESPSKKQRTLFESWSSQRPEALAFNAALGSFETRKNVKTQSLTDALAEVHRKAAIWSLAYQKAYPMEPETETASATGAPSEESPSKPPPLPPKTRNYAGSFWVSDAASAQSPPKPPRILRSESSPPPPTSRADVRGETEPPGKPPEELQETAKDIQEFLSFSTDFFRPYVRITASPPIEEFLREGFYQSATSYYNMTLEQRKQQKQEAFLSAMQEPATMKMTKAEIQDEKISESTLKIIEKLKSQAQELEYLKNDMVVSFPSDSDPQKVSEFNQKVLAASTSAMNWLQSYRMECLLGRTLPDTVHAFAERPASFLLKTAEFYALGVGAHSFGRHDLVKEIRKFFRDLFPNVTNVPSD